MSDLHVSPGRCARCLMVLVLQSAREAGRSHAMDVRQLAGLQPSQTCGGWKESGRAPRSSYHFLNHRKRERET